MLRWNLIQANSNHTQGGTTRSIKFQAIHEVSGGTHIYGTLSPVWPGM